MVEPTKNSSDAVLLHSQPVFRSEDLPLRHLLLVQIEQLDRSHPDYSYSESLHQKVPWLNSTFDMETLLYNNRNFAARIYSAYRERGIAVDMSLYENVGAFLQ
jgi:hypothetical protein